VRILLCPFGSPGYLYPAVAVGRELLARGDEVYLLGHPEARRVAASAGLATLDLEEYGSPLALQIGRWMVEGARQYQAIRRAIAAVDADALLTSVLCLGALLAAESTDVSAVVLGFATHIWSYRSDGFTEPDAIHSRSGVLAQLLDRYARLRDQVGMFGRSAPPGDRALIASGLLLRGGPALTPAGAELPEGVRYIGPCWWEPPARANELAEIDAHVARVGKPVVYVHLGRAFGGDSLWPRLNAMFTGGGFQAIVEQGRSAAPEPAVGADVLVVRKPWLSPLVARAGLVLTNATSTPVLGALRAGRPLVVAPNGSEQLFLADACVRSGTAAVLPTDPAACARALGLAWGCGPLRERALAVAAELSGLDGAADAASVLHLVTTGKVHA
jgi:UDP:flavonoid glycosyltransferase YjiC (YdhE family)